MAKEKKLTQSEIDGVQYRRAKLWQIILVACNAFIGMSIYSLINMASYAASIGFGITTAVVGVILTCTRILDGITDPMHLGVFTKFIIYSADQTVLKLNCDLPQLTTVHFEDLLGITADAVP